jgi:hypothetical protein
MPAVANAAHAVCQEVINAGVYVSAGGLENQPASIVAADGAVTDGPYPEAIGGYTLVDVPSREEVPQSVLGHQAGGLRDDATLLLMQWTGP